MFKRTLFCLVWIGVWIGLRPVVGRAQPSEDAMIDTIRTLSTIGDNDRLKIGEWVEREVGRLIAGVQGGTDRTFKGEWFRAFRDRFARQYEDRRNTPQFKAQLALRFASVATARFNRDNLDKWVARSLARVLLDMDRSETFEGLVACLKSTDDAARFFCAKGLAQQQNHIASDKARLDQAVRVLREAGVKEASPVILSRIYLALAYPNHVEEVFDAFSDIFESRLRLRRGPAVVADYAEVDAFEFFRTPGVQNALDAGQKSELVGAVAVFLRLDAERYSTAVLPHDEIATLERRVWAAEEILGAVVGGAAGGAARKELEAGGHAVRRQVLREVYRWVGDPKTKTPGPLNQAPWNVPIGAP